MDDLIGLTLKGGRQNKWRCNCTCTWVNIVPNMDCAGFKMHGGSISLLPKCQFA